MVNKGIKSVSFGGNINFTQEELKAVFGGSIELPKQEIKGFEYYFRRGNKVFFRDGEGTNISFSTTPEIVQNLQKGKRYHISAQLQNQENPIDLNNYSVKANKE